LRLLAGGGLKAHEQFRWRRRANGSHVFLQLRVAAAVACGSNLVEERFADSKRPANPS
jgi:hypothetical protein